MAELTGNLTYFIVNFSFFKKITLQGALCTDFTSIMNKVSFLPF